MNLHIQTYCSGPVLRSSAAIDTHTMVHLLDALQQSFGDGYAFRLEPITEGGIEMSNWPGKAEGQFAYKTLRFSFRDHGTWPVIGSDTEAKWRTSPPVIIWTPPPVTVCKRRRQVVTKIDGACFLKAFYAAPAWTKAELTSFMNALESVGISHTKSSVPSIKRLRFAH